MKKIALACAIMLVFANSALAYENKDIGFSVKNSFKIVEGSNAEAFKFSCKNQEEHNECAHTINFISNDVASKICGEKFSTSFFNEQYEKLALLKRSELNLKTIPLTIWDLDKYIEEGIALPYSDLELNKEENLTSYVGIDKVGKYKVITVCHFYKQNRKLYALNTSITSMHDKLFVLTSYNVNSKVLAKKEEDKSEEVPMIIQKMLDKEEEKLTDVIPAEIDQEERSKIWNEHLKFIKSLKIKG